MKANQVTLTAQYPGRLSAPITANSLEGHFYSLLSGLIQDLDSIMKGASPNQHQHSAAIRAGSEKIKQRLEEANCKIHVLEERVYSARDEADSWVNSDMPLVLGAAGRHPTQDYSDG